MPQSVRYLPDDMIDVWYMKVDVDQYNDHKKKLGTSWLQEVKQQFEELNNKRKISHYNLTLLNIFGCRQLILSTPLEILFSLILTIKDNDDRNKTMNGPINYKFDPEESNLHDIVEDLDIPDQHNAQKYIPITVIKTIFKSMKQMQDKLEKFENDLNLTEITNQIQNLSSILDEKTSQIDEINQKLIKRNRDHDNRMTLRKWFLHLNHNRLNIRKKQVGCAKLTSTLAKIFKRHAFKSLSNLKYIKSKQAAQSKDIEVNGRLDSIQQATSQLSVQLASLSTSKASREEFKKLAISVDKHRAISIYK